MMNNKLIIKIRNQKIKEYLIIRRIRKYVKQVKAIKVINKKVNNYIANR